MDPLTWLLIGLIVTGVSSIIKAGTAYNAKTATNEAIDDVYTAQKDRLQHAYDAQLTNIQESAQVVRGQQNQALVAMGHTGGMDSAAAAVIEGTTQEEKKDIDLLDQNLADAIADLDAETNLARTRTDNQYNAQMAGIVTDAIEDIADIGMGYADMVLGQRSTYSTILGGGDSWLDSTEPSLLSPMA